MLEPPFEIINYLSPRRVKETDGKWTADLDWDAPRCLTAHSRIGNSFRVNCVG